MTKDMTTGPITPLLVNFTVPLVLGNLFQLTYNAVDSIIVVTSHNLQRMHQSFVDELLRNS